MLKSITLINSLKSIANGARVNAKNERQILNYLINFNRSASVSSSTANASASNSVKDDEKLSSTDFGLLFDIDGVLVRGKTLLPKTRDCIKLITDKNGKFKIPTVFVTNAGNELRSSKAAKLSNLLGVYVDADQVVMSHSPLKLFKKFHDKRCLISGQGPIVEIAKNLGFKSLITIDDLRQYYPYLDVVDHKRRNYAPCALGRYFPPIEAVILFGESIRWETNLQLIIDVLMCNGKLDQSSVQRFPNENLPILACNTDMIWMAEAPMPRFGHGTFLHCLEQIYQKLSGKELKYTGIVGKPCEITYYYAERMIQSFAESIGIKQKIRRLYAIGDNLDTDIYGANVYNQILENNKRYREKLTDKAQMSTKTQMLVRNEMGGRITSMINELETTSNLSSGVNVPHGIHEEAHSRFASSLNASTSTSSASTSSTSTYSTNSNESSSSSPYVSETESIASILVKTGVFQGDLNDINNHSVDMALAHKDMIVDPTLIKPNFIVDNVFDAVKLIYQIEKY